MKTRSVKYLVILLILAGIFLIVSCAFEIYPCYSFCIPSRIFVQPQQKTYDITLQDKGFYSFQDRGLNVRIKPYNTYYFIPYIVYFPRTEFDLNIENNSERPIIISRMMCSLKLGEGENSTYYPNDFHFLIDGRPLIQDDGSKAILKKGQKGEIYMRFYVSDIHRNFDFNLEIIPESDSLDESKIMSIYMEREEARDSGESVQSHTISIPMIIP